MVLNLSTEIEEVHEFSNFCEVDWGEFHKELGTQLDKLPPIAPIDSQGQLNNSCASLTKAIQQTINTQVPTSTITSKSKRWWTKELMQLWHATNKLGQ